MKLTKETERNLSFDILRILSALSVVILHVSAKYAMSYDVYSSSFKVANFINSISRFGVPVFIMISGAIFLSETKQITTQKIWTRNILRLFIIYIVWSFAYYVFQSLYFWKFDFWNHGLIRTITGCVYSSDHFWFIFTIMGLYALVPLLRTCNLTRESLRYFNILFIVFQILRTTVTLLIDKSLVYKISGMVQITELSGYLGYFILGYYLTHYKLSRKTKTLIYSLVPVGIVVNYFVSDYMSAKAGTYSSGIYDCFGIFTFIHVIAIFVFITDFTDKLHFTKTACTFLHNLAIDTLGIYIMHVALLEFLINESIVIGQVPTFVGILLLSVICFTVCGVASALLRRLPYIGRYLC